MIRINLLKGIRVQKSRKTLFLTCLFILAGVVGIGAIAAGTIIIVRDAGSPRSEARPSSPKAASAQPTAAEKTAVAPGNLVERICHEMTYAWRSFGVLVKAIPTDAGPITAVEIDSFKVIRISGLAPDRKTVLSIFAALKRSDITLMPRPHTKVAPTARGSYEYTASGRPAFAFDPNDPFVSSVLAAFPKPTDHKAAVTTFEQLAATQRVKMGKGLRYVSGQKAKAYRRYVYRMNATSSYHNLVRFVNALYRNRVPCAFSKLRFTGRSSSLVKISADLYFVAKE